MSETNNIRMIFEQIASAPTQSRPYRKKKHPATITLRLDEQKMEMLNVMADRIGATRAGVANIILEVGIYDAARGCGFVLDDDGNIPEDQKGKWDVAPRQFGFSFIPSKEEDE